MTRLICFVLVLFFACFSQAETVHKLVPNGTSAPSVEQNTSAFGSELSNLPASITDYNAGRHEPDAKPSDDYDTYGGHLCAMPDFKCIRIEPKETWIGLWRNERLREIVMRLNRTNVALRYRHWIVVPKNLKSTRYMDLSPLPEHIEAKGHRTVLVDLRVFAFGAYDEDGDLVYWGPASGGA